MLLVGGFFPQIYNTTDEIKSLATSFIAVSAIIMPFCAFTHSSYFTLRSGGKTLVTFLFDSVFTWVIVVPVAFVLAKYTVLGIGVLPCAGHRADKGSHRILHGEKRRVARADGIGM